MSNQLPGSVGESQPLTLPRNYRRVHSGFQGPFGIHSGSVQIPFRISGFIQVPFGIHSGSIQVPFRVHSGFQGPFRFHWGSILVPFTISGSIQDPFRFIHDFRVRSDSIWDPFRFIQDFRVHSGSIQDPFRIWGSRWDPFRVRAASPLPYHLPIGWYENRFQTFSTYPYIYIKIYLLCRISFQGPWERVNPWLSQGITVGSVGSGA